MAIRAQPARGGLSGRVMPQTNWGRWSVGSAAAFVLLQVVALFAISAGVESSAPAVVVLTGLGLISGTAAAVVGVASIIWRRERSILVFLSAAVGFVVFAFWVGLMVSEFTRGGTVEVRPESQPTPLPSISVHRAGRM